MAGCRISSIFALVALAVAPILACSWDYSVWPKSKKSDIPLFRFVVNEKYGGGYINRQGQVVIQPQFRALGNSGGDFFDGLANVVTKDGDFYIDATGKRVASAEFGRDFSEGLAVWQSGSSNKRLGYIDRTGKLVIPAKYDSANDFSGGLAAVEIANRWGYINRSGELVIPTRFVFADDFSEGHALVVENGPCHWNSHACMDLDVGITIPEDAKSNAGVPERCHYSVIDTMSKIVFASSYVDAKHFSEGLAPMGDGEHWGFADYMGKIVIPLQFEDAEPFSEGLARVRRNGKYGFIDKTGGFVIPPELFGADDFSEGLTVAMTAGHKYYFIDKSGKRAVPGIYDGASSFVMGLAHVRAGQDYYSAKWSYIDKTGKAVFTYSDQSNRPATAR